ncbi:MAG: hypothetical protein L0Z62_27760 [Gemmataceae bacterium]|nr:hypothetical protein [Gemmataceae bacterium]
MRNLLKRLWDDDGGFIVSFELMLVFVVLLLGIIAGLANLRMAVVNELTETGQSILTLNQGYSITGLTGCSGSSAPSGATDVCGTNTLTSSTTVCTISSTLCP